MKHRTHAWIDDQLSASEEKASCYVPHTKKEQKRLRRAMQEGYVVEVAPTLFARASYWSSLRSTSRMRHKILGLQELHPNWVFAGPSAGVAWGLAVSNRYLDKVWVATTRRAHGKELAFRRDVIVSHDEGEINAGVRLTSFARTVGDCLRIMDFRSGLALLDSALRVSLKTGDELMDMLEQACRHMPGLRRMRAMMSLGDARAESGGESIARATMLELGLALPDLQRVFHSPLAPGTDYRVDFAWEMPGGAHLVGEMDGIEKYENPAMTAGRSISQVIDDEHRRQTHIEACPDVLRVVRFGFADVMRDQAFLSLLTGCGVQRSFEMDAQVLAAGGVLRCRAPQLRRCG